MILDLCMECSGTGRRGMDDWPCRECGGTGLVEPEDDFLPPPGDQWDPDCLFPGRCVCPHIDHTSDMCATAEMLEQDHE